jgi:hypothetical protein
MTNGVAVRAHHVTFLGLSQEALKRPVEARETELLGRWISVMKVQRLGTD